jgi:Family of unknown function (DUF5677)
MSRKQVARRKAAKQRADEEHLRRQLALLRRCLALVYQHGRHLEQEANRALREMEDATRVATFGAFAYFTEMVSSCYSLIGERRLSATYAVARVALTSIADLQNLMQDELYPLHMEAVRLKEWIRFLDNALKYPSSMTEPMTEEFDLKAELRKMTELAGETRSKGGRPLTDWQRLDRAGRLDEYRSVYWLWSLHAHGSLGAIYGAHATTEGIFMFRPKDAASAFFPEADALCTMTIGVMYMIFPQFGIPTKKVDRLRRELSEIRAVMGFRDDPSLAAPGHSTRERG